MKTGHYILATEARKGEKYLSFLCVSLRVKRCAVAIIFLPFVLGFSTINAKDSNCQFLYTCLHTQFSDTNSFTRSVIYGDTEEVFLGEIQAIGVDDSGRIFMADKNKVTIHVYNPKGTYNKSIGRQGRGPGEFLRMTPITGIVVYKNSLLVSGTDGMLSIDNIHHFSLDDLSLSESISIQNEVKEKFDSELENYYPTSIYPMDEGTLLVAYQHIRSPAYFMQNEHTIRYYQLSMEGEILKGPVLKLPEQATLHRFHEGRGYIYFSFPFFKKPLLTVSESHIYFVNSGQFIINVYNRDGTPLRVIEHSIDKVSTTRKKLIQLYEKQDMSRLDYFPGENAAVRMIQEADHLPDFWPALNNILVDDENRIWVSTFVEDFDIYEWWVLEETGDVITRFEWPRNKSIELVKNGFVYTLESDEETDLQQVVRYRIEFRETR